LSAIGIEFDIRQRVSPGKHAKARYPRLAIPEGVISDSRLSLEKRTQPGIARAARAVADLHFQRRV
jgi:hypothetical protein